jgi:hypothetical protein
MKQLIVTFFAIVLCYSLFFDKKPSVSVVDQLNYIYDYVLIDTLNVYTYSIIHPMNMNRWDSFTVAVDKNREDPASILIKP